MAIQVNGTTVIDNSRNLTNIASVDATTAAAIGAAGVGGATTLISEGSISSSIAYLDFTFPSGYDNFIIILNEINNGSANTGFGFRWLDSSNNPVTTSSYSGYTWAETNNTYWGNANVYLTVTKPRDSSVRTFAWAFSPESNISSPSQSDAREVWLDSSARQCNGVRFFSGIYGIYNMTAGKYQLLGLN